MRRGPLLLVGLLAVWAELTPSSAAEKYCPGKPGYCPQPRGNGICVHECRRDDSCAGDLKCCSNGCGHVCTAPASNMKPGQCPMFKIPPGLPCKTECCQDSDCQATRKCCPMGCSKVCFPAGLPSLAKAPQE